MCYGARWALRDASFTIHPGEILGLIGPNGSGKTTLFRALAGLLPATAGTVTIDDAPSSPYDRSRHLYFVPDGIRPWPDQTVGEVLRFVAGVHGAAETACVEITARLELVPLAGARLGTLSKGEHRRAMTAIGLLTPAPLLMLDEPFDGLDLRQTREAMAVLRDHAAHAGRTLFLSVHQLGDAARVCDRLVLLSGGRVVGTGTVAELRETAGVPAGTPAGGLDEVFLALT